MTARGHKGSRVRLQRPEREDVRGGGAGGKERPEAHPARGQSACLALRGTTVSQVQPRVLAPLSLRTRVGGGCSRRGTNDPESPPTGWGTGSKEANRKMGHCRPDAGGTVDQKRH